ncbi:hypothetical protein LFT48_11325 [Arthrobacter sp. FW305-123]|nr:hypothetical protein LFT48_11325 [Arthrobacter sp. FW305-123]
MACGPAEIEGEAVGFPAAGAGVAVQAVIVNAAAVISNIAAMPGFEASAALLLAPGVRLLIT